MALTTASFQASISWTDVFTAISGAREVQNQDSLAVSVAPAVATYNRRLRKQYSLASLATQVIDLASFPDPYTGATLTLTKAAGFLITGTQAFRIEPNAAANPLPWVWGIAANYLVFSANAAMLIYEPVTFTTGSKLLLTNQGGSAGTFDVALIGGT